MIIHRPDPSSPRTLCRQPGIYSDSLLYIPTCLRCNQMHAYQNERENRVWSEFFISAIIRAGYIKPDIERLAKDIDTPLKTIYSWLKGNRLPRSNSLEKLSLALRLTKQELDETIKKEKENRKECKNDGSS